MDHIISISPDGTVRTLYTDKIDLRDFGPLKVERASNVEWDDKQRGWTVQFVDGTYLRSPSLLQHMAVFETREAALAAEVAYLQARL